MTRSAAALLLLAVAGFAPSGESQDAIPVTKRSRSPQGEPVEQPTKLDPKTTAIVVCDMWDDHWCKSAAARCGELAKQADPVLKACRAKGMTIVHAPSDCMKFYEDHPARKRTLAVKKVEPPKEKVVECPALPIDDSDGGCDDAAPAKQFKAWTRQHAAITIDPEKDYISDRGDEVYGVLREKGITTLLVMGVHTNMCVLNRSFAIKQMVRWGVEVYLVRDLTDAMYNPKMRPMVTHREGTDLVIAYIERYWCPSIEGKQLFAAK
jgi:nicotinamidase-related amidase